MNKLTRMMILSGDKHKEPREDERRRDRDEARRYREDERYPDYDYPETRRRYNVNISNNRYYPRPMPIYDDGDYDRDMPPRGMGGYGYPAPVNPIGFANMHHGNGDEYRDRQKTKHHDEYGAIIDVNKKRKMAKMDRETADEWTENMKNKDDTKGAHWTYEQCEQAMRQRGVDCDPTEFFVAMNMMYSDYYGVAKMLNMNTVDFYVYMAKAFLDDDDAKENKLMRYYEYIVE